MFEENIGIKFPLKDLQYFIEWLKLFDKYTLYSK